MIPSTERWGAGELYEPYMGRWSRLVAREFVPWLEVHRDASWLDVGAGTGALAQAILDMAWPGEVTGVDPAPGVIEDARRRLQGVRFELGDARSLPSSGSSFDAVVSGLVLDVVPEPAGAIAEMVRVARPGGVIAAYVWDYAGEMQMLRSFWDAAVELDPGATELHEGRRLGALCNEVALAGLCRDAGLRDVLTRPIDVLTTFRDFDDFWTPFLSDQAPAPGYCVSLSSERREALRERLRTTLPQKPDGSIHLIARAWAVRGRK